VSVSRLSLVEYLSKPKGRLFALLLALWILSLTHDEPWKHGHARKGSIIQAIGRYYWDAAEHIWDGSAYLVGRPDAGEWEIVRADSADPNSFVLVPAPPPGFTPEEGRRSRWEFGLVIVKSTIGGALLLGTAILAWWTAVSFGRPFRRRPQSLTARP
jgi:hypothetical protein